MQTHLNMPADEKPRNELGQFAPRNDADMSIAQVLQQSEPPPAPEPDKGAAAAKPADTKPDPNKKIELSADAGSFLGDFVEGRATKEQTDEEKAAAEKKKAKDIEDAEKLKKQTARQKPKPRQAEPTGLTADQIAAVAEGVARVIKPPTETKKAEETPDAGAAKFTPSDERKIAVLAHMEKMFPDKYKGAANRFRDSITKIEEYAAKWQKDHPSQEFNEEDEEHTEFFEKNQLHEFWDPDEFEDAKLKMHVDKALEEERRTNNTKLTDINRQIKLRDPETLAAIDTEQVTAANHYWKMFGDDSNILKPDGTVDEEKAKALREADPESYDIRINAAARLEYEVAELYLLMSGLKKQAHAMPARADFETGAAGDRKFNQAAGEFRTQRDLESFAATAEQRLVAKQKDDRIDADGRDFLPADKYYAVPKAEREKNYWTFSARDLAVIRAAQRARETQELIKAEDEKFEKRAKSRGLVPKEGATASRKADDAEPDPKTETDDGKPLSPEAGSETILAAGRGATGKGSQRTGTSFFDTNW